MNKNDTIRTIANFLGDPVHFSQLPAEWFEDVDGIRHAKSKCKVSSARYPASPTRVHGSFADLHDFTSLHCDDCFSLLLIGGMRSENWPKKLESSLINPATQAAPISSLEEALAIKRKVYSVLKLSPKEGSEVIAKLFKKKIDEARTADFKRMQTALLSPPLHQELCYRVSKLSHPAQDAVSEHLFPAQFAAREALIEKTARELSQDPRWAIFYHPGALWLTSTNEILELADLVSSVFKITSRMFAVPIGFLPAFYSRRPFEPSEIVILNGPPDPAALEAFIVLSTSEGLYTDVHAAWRTAEAL